MSRLYKYDCQIATYHRDDKGYLTVTFDANDTDPIVMSVPGVKLTVEAYNAVNTVLRMDDLDPEVRKILSPLTQSEQT